MGTGIGPIRLGHTTILDIHVRAGITTQEDIVIRRTTTTGRITTTTEIITERITAVLVGITTLVGIATRIRTAHRRITTIRITTRIPRTTTITLRTIRSRIRILAIRPATVTRMLAPTRTCVHLGTTTPIITATHMHRYTVPHIITNTSAAV